MDKLKQILLTQAELINQSLSDSQATNLILYLELITKWNKIYSLSAINDPIIGIHKHLLDSLAINPYIEDGTLLDVGSGAGLPGIVLAIVRPNLVVSVVDSVGKKCRFMQFVKSQLGLNNLTIIHSRVEDLKNTTCFMQITARAFAKTDKICAMTKYLLCDNGRWLLMKGPRFKAEKLPEFTQVHRLHIASEISSERYLLEIGRTP